jgi:hypothetical protein
MPLFLGNKNTRGLPVSPALQSLKIDLLRAAPSSVNIIARPTVTQPGFAAYINHLPAFMKANNEKITIPLNKQGYVTNFAVEKCIPIPHPSLVVDYNGPIPNKFVEGLSTLGFERIVVHKNDNILRFPSPSLNDIRAIKKTTPNTKTPSPAQTVNMEAFDTWILSLRVITNLLHTHIYPAFRDDGHIMEEIERMVDELMTSKRAAEPMESQSAKRARLDEEGNSAEPNQGGEDVEMVEELLATLTSEVPLRKAKYTQSSESKWGSSDEIPNASGIFFPYIPELASFDNVTIPHLFETYLLQSLGNTPEQQIDRLDKIRSLWGIISKTDSGNILAHLGKVIHLSFTAQGRCFPIIQDEVYQGSVLSGARYFIGINGQIQRPLSFDKLQQETGSFHLHSGALKRIAAIVCGVDEVEDDSETLAEVRSTTTLRQLRGYLMKQNLSEEDRDEIKRVAKNLHYKNDSHLAVNAQTIARVLSSMTDSDQQDDITLPMHHSALFSRDNVFVSLSSFGFQAPSFNIDNCPRVSLKDSKPPTTLVIRQKTLEVATLDWKNMLDNQEIKNNPRNLSRANRDRTLTGNDKVVIWDKLKKLLEPEDTLLFKGKGATIVVEERDSLDEW